jgi:hypothetical protein
MSDNQSGTTMGPQNRVILDDDVLEAVKQRAEAEGKTLDQATTSCVLASAKPGGSVSCSADGTTDARSWAPSPTRKPYRSPSMPCTSRAPNSAAAD